jgi:hypothetical protein
VLVRGSGVGLVEGAMGEGWEGEVLEVGWVGEGLVVV